MPRAAAAGAYAAMVLADGASAYYRLNDTNGAAVDLVGASGPGSLGAGGITQGNAGALPGDPSGSTFFPNLTNAYIHIPDAPSLKFAGDYTLEAWVNTNVVDAGHHDVICKAVTVGTREYELRISASQFLFLAYDSASAAFTVVSPSTGPLAPRTGAWAHLVATKAGSALTLYVNGQIAGQTTFGGTGINGSTTGEVAIGAFAVQAGQPWGGYIQEVAFYPKALSALRVAQHYLAGSASPRAAVDYRRLVLSDAPSAYWRCNDAASPLVDQVGTYPASGFGAGATFQQPGPLADGDTAIFSNGTSAYFQVGTVLGFSPGTPFTVEAWFRANALAGPGSYFDLISRRDPGGGNPNYEMVIEGTNRRFQFFAGGAAASSGAATDDDGRWYHVVGVYDGANVLLYKNGVLVGGPTATTPLNTAAQILDIGKDPSLGRNMNGWLDEVAIYPYALTAPQALRHYLTGLRGKGAGSRAGGSYANVIKADRPTSYWRLNDTGATAADAVGANTGTLGAGIGKSVAGAILDGDTAMSFDGTTNGVITFAGVTLLGDWTMEAWVYPTAFPNGHNHIITGGSGAPALDVTAAGVFYVTQVSTLDAALSSFTLPVNAWTHLVATYVLATQTLRYYANGVLVGSPSFPYTQGAGGPVSRIGQTNNYASAWLGKIDEPAVYNLALTAQQVLDHYTAGLALRRALSQARAAA